MVRFSNLILVLLAGVGKSKGEGPETKSSLWRQSASHQCDRDEWAANCANPNHREFCDHDASILLNGIPRSICVPISALPFLVEEGDYCGRCNQPEGLVLEFIYPSRTPTEAPSRNPSEAPVTAAPVTAAPVTSAPVTAAPVTAAPVTSAPVTAAPVTAAPVTAAPVTSAPVTAAPVTAVLVTSAPVTAAPITAAPDPTGKPSGSSFPSSEPSGNPSAAPITAAPITAAPVTAAPVTAAPSIATQVAPDSAAPITAAPSTSEPSGSSFPSSEPSGNPSAAPVTAAPVTAAPSIATQIAPVSAAPVTAAPVTPTERENSPPFDTVVAITTFTFTSINGELSSQQLADFEDITRSFLNVRWPYSEYRATIISSVKVIAQAVDGGRRLRRLSNVVNLTLEITGAVTPNGDDPYDFPGLISAIFGSNKLVLRNDLFLADIYISYP